SLASGKAKKGLVAQKCGPVPTSQSSSKSEFRSWASTCIKCLTKRQESVLRVVTRTDFPNQFLINCDLAPFSRLDHASPSLSRWYFCSSESLSSSIPFSSRSELRRSNRSSREVTLPNFLPTHIKILPKGAMTYTSEAMSYRVALK